MDEYDYFMAQREDEYDPEEAPYEPLAPDLAGQSPLASWRATEARPSGSQQQDESGMRLREASVAGASPTPTTEEATGEVVTVPSHYLPRSEAEAQDPNSNFNILTGGGTTKPAQQETYLGKLSRVMQTYASGVYERAADVFGRSRGQ